MEGFLVYFLAFKDADFQKPGNKEYLSFLGQSIANGNYLQMLQRQTPC